jgi:hypothetical protein
MSHLQHTPARGGEADELASLGRGLGHRLLEEDVGSLREQVAGDREVARGGRCDADRIDLPRQGTVVGQPRHPELGCNPLAGLRGGIDHGQKFAPGQLGVLLGVEPTEVAHADHPCADFFHAAVYYARVVRRHVAWAEGVPLPSPVPSPAAPPRGITAAAPGPAPAPPPGSTPLPPESPPAGAPHVLRRELLILAAGLAVGLFVMPALIFEVGSRTLGSYAGGGLGALVKAFLRGLAGGAPAFWAVALGPYLLAMALRLLVSGVRRVAEAD